MAKNNLTSEPDGPIPTDEQAAKMIQDRDADYATDSNPQAPDTAGHPYGDGAYSEGARSTLDRLRKGAPYGAAGGDK